MKILANLFHKNPSFERSVPYQYNSIFLETNAIPVLSRSPHLLITGCSGSGKTYSGVYYEIERSIKQNRNIFYIGRECCPGEPEFHELTLQFEQKGYTVYKWNINEISSLDFKSIDFTKKTAIFCYSLTAWSSQEIQEIQLNYQKYMMQVLDSCKPMQNPPLTSVIIIDGLDFYEKFDNFQENLIHGWEYNIQFVFTINSFLHLQEFLSKEELQILLNTVTHAVMYHHTALDSMFLKEHQIFSYEVPFTYQYQNKQIAYQELDGKLRAFQYPSRPPRACWNDIRPNVY